MLEFYVIGRSVVMLLAAYLVRRYQDRLPPTLRRKIVLDGAAIDVGPVRERVQQLRRDYFAGIRALPHSRSRREAIHLAARKMVRSLVYVQHLEAKSDHSSATESQVQ